MTDPFRTPGQAIWLEGIGHALVKSGDLARLGCLGQSAWRPDGPGNADSGGPAWSRLHGRAAPDGTGRLGGGTGPGRVAGRGVTRRRRFPAPVRAHQWERGICVGPGHSCHKRRGLAGRGEAILGGDQPAKRDVAPPATPDLLAAFEHAVADGLNLDIGWIYSLERHADAVEAYTRA